ncbi:MAG: chemotaxis protein CheD [Planctomycetaceae bacterium]|jgi:chemotaxis protein CheD|nr:chemotaxis protein CheD [Planctomycetaceae bacterium]
MSRIPATPLRTAVPPAAPPAAPVAGTLGRVADADRVVVGVADLAVSRDATKSIITYALGSCIGVTVYDPVAKVGGMLHFMLPESSVSKEKAAANPAMFGDLGIPLLFEKVIAAGAKRERLVVCAAGGAEVLADDGHFRIGNRNRTILRKIFWKLNLLLAADDTGGQHSRTLTLRLADGSISIRAQGKETPLWPH